MKKAENQHFYRLPVSTEKGQALKNILDRCDEAMKASALLAAELGAVRFTQNGAFLAGSIGNLYFTKKPNERAYETVRRRGRYYECFPNRGKEAGAKIFARIMSLPVVSFSVLTTVFGDMPQGTVTPTIFEYKEDLYLASATPLTIDGLEDIHAGTFAAMETARKLTLEEPS